MVNLPKEEQELDEDIPCIPFETVPPSEPINLEELESVAATTANLMNPYSSHPNCYQIVMNRVRQFFNLEFKLCFIMIGNMHREDEVTAPER